MPLFHRREAATCFSGMGRHRPLLPSPRLPLAAALLMLAMIAIGVAVACDTDANPFDQAAFDVPTRRPDLTIPLLLCTRPAVTLTIIAIITGLALRARQPRVVADRAAEAVRPRRVLDRARGRRPRRRDDGTVKRACGQRGGGRSQRCRDRGGGHGTSRATTKVAWCPFTVGLTRPRVDACCERVVRMRWDSGGRVGAASLGGRRGRRRTSRGFPGTGR